MTSNLISENPTGTSIVSAMAADVERFQREVLNFSVPVKPRFLTGDLFSARLNHMNEELFEFQSAHSIEGQADGLIDLIYVALGALIQMGVCPKAGFDEVHAANMRKHKGTVLHRPATAGIDAAKPEDWTPPDIAKLLSITMVDIDWMVDNKVRQIDIAGQTFSATSGESVSVRALERARLKPLLDDEDDDQPRILVLGYARHGKDTVSEMLRDQYGFSFTSSSLFCAGRVMMPYFDKLHASPPAYADTEECFEDRANHRAEWYRAISEFNTPDLTALGRAIFDEYDVYCGLRNHSEFHALKNIGAFDICIWVDALDRHIPEGTESCTVEPWMADFVLDNNGSLEDLENNLESLMGTIMRTWSSV